MFADISMKIKKQQWLRQISLFMMTVGLPVVYSIYFAVIDKEDYSFHEIFILIFSHIIFIVLASFIPREILEESELLISLKEENLELKRKEVDFLKTKIELQSMESQIAFTYQSLRKITNDYLLGIEEPEDLTEIFKNNEPQISEVLGVLVADRNPLFGINSQEIWNFSLYICNGNELVPFWRKMNDFGERSDRHWPIGKGHTGYCFQHNEELLTSSKENSDILKAKGTLYRDYDDKQFKSLIAVPIRLGEPTDEFPEYKYPYGVLIATSDQKERFNESNHWIMIEIAKYIALLLWLSDSIDS